MADKTHTATVIKTDCSNKSSAAGLTVDPCMLMIDMLIHKSNCGIIKGKLSTAISTKLLPARDAMAATMVSIEAKPVAPVNRFTAKSAFLVITGDGKNKKKPATTRIEITNSSIT